MNLDEILLRSTPEYRRIQAPMLSDEELARIEDEEASARQYRSGLPGSPPITEVDYGAMARDGFVPQKNEDGGYDIPETYQLPQPIPTMDIVERERLRDEYGEMFEVPPTASSSPVWDYLKNLGGAAAQGVTSAIQEYINIAHEMAKSQYGGVLPTGMEGGPTLSPEEMLLWYGQVESTRDAPAPRLPDAPGYTPGQSILADFVKPLTQFVTGYLGPGGLLKSAKLPTLPKEFARSAIAASLSFDPDEGNLATAIRQEERIMGFLSELGISDEDLSLLDSSEGDNEFVKRLKLAVEDGLLGGAVISALGGLKMTAKEASRLADQISKGVMDAMNEVGTGRFGPARQYGRVGSAGQPERSASVVDSVVPGTTVSTRQPGPLTANQRAAGQVRPGEGDITGLRTGLDAMRASGEQAFAKNLSTFDDMVTTFKVDPNLPLDDKAQALVRGFADNLLWLHDHFVSLGSEMAERATHWYPGANVLAQELAAQYSGILRQGSSIEQVSGIIAVLSPQKDWFQNMDQARRVLSVSKELEASGWQHSDETRRWVEQYADKQAALARKKAYKDAISAGNADSTAKKKAKAVADARRQKELGRGNFDVAETAEQKAILLRAWDESFNDRSYDVLSPDAEVIGKATKESDGTLKTSAWGSFGSIAKAVRIIEDGSVENISAQLGGEHKVRNFYNNIADPFDAGSVTIDTHAVAAAQLRPFSGSSLEVTQNFGGRGSAGSVETGQSGTYGLYHEAYNLAASERGIQPRAMQSITWEAVRGLFEASQKTGGLDKKVKALWESVQSGEIPLDEGFRLLEEITGGVKMPAWAEGAK